MKCIFKKSNRFSHSSPNAILGLPKKFSKAFTNDMFIIFIMFIVGSTGFQPVRQSIQLNVNMLEKNCPNNIFWEGESPDEPEVRFIPILSYFWQHLYK